MSINAKRKMKQTIPIPRHIIFRLLKIKGKEKNPEKKETEGEWGAPHL